MNNKQYHLNVLVPFEMKESLVRLAHEAGFVNLSEYIRHIVRGYLSIER